MALDLISPKDFDSIQVGNHLVHRPLGELVIELSDSDILCPQCTSPMNKDTVLLRRDDAEWRLCSLACAVRHNRFTPGRYTSSVISVEKKTKEKKSGHF